MSTAENQVADILARYGEPMAGNVWKVQGQSVIYHKALERIAAQAGITYDPPTIVRAERDEAVILVTGRLGGTDARVEWSIGEALIGVNYRVSGKQAAYVFAMAEKRAKDRVILKLIGLHGLLYSEDEADDFRDEIKRQKAQERLAQRQARQPDQPRTVFDPATGGQVAAKPAEQPSGTVVDFPGQDSIDDGIAASLRKSIDRCKSINAVTDLMLKPDTQRSLNDLPQATRNELRDYAKARLVALGWPTKAAQ